MLIIATVDFFEGLIAVIRGEYYVLAPNQIVVFDTTAWGWITMFWGIVVACAGFGLLTGRTGHVGSRSSPAASTSSCSSASSAARSTHCGR